MVNITTTNGTCNLLFWCSASFDAEGADVLVIETSWTQNERCLLEFVPEIAESTWTGRDARYVPNPPPVNKTTVISPESVLTLISQPHLPQKGTWHTTGYLRSQFDPLSATYILAVSPIFSSQTGSDSWVSNGADARRAVCRRAAAQSGRGIQQQPLRRTGFRPGQ